MGIGGSVGSGGVRVGAGVGGVETDGTGAIVGGFVWLGGAVGAANDGDTVGVVVGVAVRASVAIGSVDAGPGSVCGGNDVCAGVPEGDAVTLAGASLGEFRPSASRVRLNPARATPTASDGPSSTYKVKDARPVWPGALPLGFPALPTPDVCVTGRHTPTSDGAVTTVLNRRSPARWAAHSRGRVPLRTHLWTQAAQRDGCVPSSTSTEARLRGAANRRRPSRCS